MTKANCSHRPKLFGTSVSIANSLAIVGAPAIGHRGKVYTYHLKSATKKSSFDPICAFGGHDDDGFGISCKIIHDASNSTNCQKVYYAIIGAHQNYENGLCAGAAYIFSTQNEGETWLQDTKLMIPSFKNRSYFGCSVDLSPGVAIVGAYGDNTQGLCSGSAHIFINSTMENKDGWFLAHSLYPELTLPQNVCLDDCNTHGISFVNFYFGFSVAITSNYAVVGAPSENKGSAFLFYSSGSWNDYGTSAETKTVTTRKLYNARENRFGFSVSADGMNILVGAPGSEGRSGTATLFALDAFMTNGILKIPSNETVTGDEITTQSLSARSLFGRSVALLNDSIFISGHGRSCENVNVGSAFLFIREKCLRQRTQNTEEHYKICPRTCIRDKVSKELFGHDIDLSTQFVIIGDPSNEMAHVCDLTTLRTNQRLKRWFPSTLKLLASDFFSYSINIHDT